MIPNHTISLFHIFIALNELQGCRKKWHTFEILPKKIYHGKTTTTCLLYILSYLTFVVSFWYCALEIRTHKWRILDTMTNLSVHLQYSHRILEVKSNLLLTEKKMNLEKISSNITWLSSKNPATCFIWKLLNEYLSLVFHWQTTTSKGNTTY